MQLIHWTIHLMYLLSLITFLWIIPWFKKKRVKGNFAKWYTDENCPAQPIYTAKNGSVFYAFENPVMMPAARAIAAEAAQRSADLCMTPEMFSKMFQKCKAFANDGNFQEAFVELSKIEERMTMAAEEVTLLNLANCYFLIEGEDPHSLTDHSAKAKMKIWAEDDECRSFFLVSAFRLISNFGNISDSDILRYLKEKKQKNPKKVFGLPNG